MGVVFLIVSPFLALLVCKVLAVFFCGNEGGVVELDQMYDSAYADWRRNLAAVGGRMSSVACPMRMDMGETCFACGVAVALYLPSMPIEPAPEGVFFDSACGMNVGQGWSIVDMVPGASFHARGTLCVTDRNLRFEASGDRQVIPLETIHTVSASCSGLLVGTWEHDRPLVFQGVNGQQFRDTLHILMEAG